MSDDRKPRRTCIGCRGVFAKNEVVRIVGINGSAAIDYREKLPGRAVYVCPRPACITKALSREALSRSLRATVAAPDPERFLGDLERAIREKLRSVLQMSLKAGKLAVGASALRDARDKGRIALVLYAEDVSGGSRERSDPGAEAAVLDLPFTKEQLGGFFGRELVALAGVLDQRFADAIAIEVKRLKGLAKRGAVE